MTTNAVWPVDLEALRARQADRVNRLRRLSRRRRNAHDFGAAPPAPGRGIRVIDLTRDDPAAEPARPEARVLAEAGTGSQAARQA